MIRSVSTGILGLDLVLQGGARVIRRIPDSDAESALLLVRGGPGTGKSILATNVALGLAAALGGDVLYACIEVLPSEVQAQRSGFGDAERFVDLSRCDKRPGAEGPLVGVGLASLEIRDDEPARLGDALLALANAASRRAFSTKVVVVDSLSDGYHLGRSASRSQIDGLCKLAIEQGWALVLVEECDDPSPSSWCFAVDTVIELSMNWAASNPRHRRVLRVAKHRFNACHPGPHRVLIEQERLRVIAPIDAYADSASILPLPKPTTGRTMTLPTPTGSLPPETLAIIDGAGHVRQLDTTRVASAQRPRLDAAFVSGASSSTWLYFGELGSGPIVDPAGAQVHGTLHQFMDGPEWLELAIWRLAQLSEVGWVFVGPASRLTSYEHRDDVGRAVSALSSVLSRSGLAVALLVDEEKDPLIRAAIVESFIKCGSNSNDTTTLLCQLVVASETIPAAVVVGPFSDAPSPSPPSQ
jgi:KaiC/GvpD/RAD55 family RecA-like ATPase